MKNETHNKITAHDFELIAEAYAVPKIHFKGLPCASIDEGDFATYREHADDCACDIILVSGSAEYVILTPVAFDDADIIVKTINNLIAKIDHTI